MIDQTSVKLSSALLRVIRDGEPRPGITLAKKHAPFGYSLAPNGGILHRVERVALAWRRGDLVRVGAKWSCGGRNGLSSNVALVPEAHGYRGCGHCDVLNRYPTGPVVYALRTRRPSGDLIKVGHTSNLASRFARSDGSVLCAVPGGIDKEKVVHEALSRYRVRGREWFSLACLPALADALGVEITDIAELTDATEEVAG